VDYKTDVWSTEAELDDKVERYSTQLRAYGDAVAIASGSAVSSACLVFAAEDPPRTVRT